MSVLSDMVDVAPDQIEDIESSLGQIQDQIADLTVQANGIQAELLDIDTSSIIAYLTDVKMPEVGGASITYGPNFATISYTTGGITDWSIDSTAGVPIYVYEGVGWDSDANITKFIDDYAFGNDYLTRPLTTGATYGIYPNITALNTAVSILTANKLLIEESITVFGDYT